MKETRLLGFTAPQISIILAIYIVIAFFSIRVAISFLFGVFVYNIRDDMKIFFLQNRLLRFLLKLFLPKSQFL